MFRRAASRETVATPADLNLTPGNPERPTFATPNPARQE
jgi:hypothetical protein